MKTRNIVIGALAGMAVGTLVGAIYGTSRADSLKDKAFKKGKDYSKGLKKAASLFLEIMKNKVDKASHEGTELLNKGNHSVARTKEKVDTILN